MYCSPSAFVDGFDASIHQRAARSGCGRGASGGSAPAPSYSAAPTRNCAARCACSAAARHLPVPRGIEQHCRERVLTGSRGVFSGDGRGQVDDGPRGRWQRKARSVGRGAARKGNQPLHREGPVRYGNSEAVLGLLTRTWPCSSRARRQHPASVALLAGRWVPRASLGGRVARA